MNIIRYRNELNESVLAVLTIESKIYVLPQSDFLSLVREAEDKGKTPLFLIEEVIENSLPLEMTLNELDLLIPVDAPEVWAAGVTYENSKLARNYEASQGYEKKEETFYDKVYNAARPEIFFKSTSARTVAPRGEVYLRSDSNWQIPEPELGLVINKIGKVIGYTIGNDMSCRDIEGENPLYLPQAKVWKNSCSIGPSIRLAETVEDPYNFDITCRIFRNEEKVFEGTANTEQLKRSYTELVSYLLKDNEIFDGTVLLTGTCIVPPNEFTLDHNDRIEIEIGGIGVLENTVKKQISQTLPSL
ncbi:fumarylacetoacetate hydrolase family protein [Metabacillus bambusae]|uniref:Fumarylacetoacetate hydrolase family protein n=1 Tax=Metabacillus bambusae TaxID=2795218 RepID=A0ABS3MW82_9BACI|nr:fumarylacetoacetate hydrolase family protein [Metabacillus bambusae]MBO1510277.1 fumarylacetoacetate hydrolase family protein [Metabacillus bambusae]